MSTSLALGAVAALVALSSARRGSPSFGRSEIDNILNRVKQKSIKSLEDKKVSSKAKEMAASQQELHPMLRQSLDYLQMHRCVLRVYEEQTDKNLEPHERLSQAFALCTSSLQKSGFLRGREPTPAGLVRSREKARDADALERERRYQELLVEAKVSRRRAREMREAPAASGLERSLRGRRRGAANRKISKQELLQLRNKIQEIREAMNPVFSCETVWGDCRDEAPSAGHCFMASVAVQDMLGGEILFGQVSTPDGDISHYWNKIGEFEIDVTGDQFKEPDIQIKKGKIRESISSFGRNRYEWMTEDYNSEPMEIYDRFRKRLCKEMMNYERLIPLIDHLMQMESAGADAH